MPRPTSTIMGAKARKAILQGVAAIYEPVRKTLGPNARKALLYRTFNRGSRIVDDGHIVADCQEPKDAHVRLVATAFKEACKRTNEKVGDGTATTACIGGKLYYDVHNKLIEGHSEFVGKGNKSDVSTIKADILAAAAVVKEKIKTMAIKSEALEDVEKIASVSVGDKTLGKIVAKMAFEVGVDGFIDVVEGYKGEIETEIIKGMRFPAKVAAKAFVNNPARYEMVAVDSSVVITNSALDNTGDITKPFKEINEHISKLIVIAPSFSENVLIQMVNASKAGFYIYPVAAPSLRTEQFDDLAIYCGATFFDKNKGKNLRSLTKADLGFLEKLVVRDTEAKEDATAVGGFGTRVEVRMIRKEIEEDGVKKKVQEEKISTAVGERIETLKGQLAETPQEQFKKLLERRIASMGSAVGIIRVGDSTQALALDRKLKVEDAVYACKAALRGGHVPGGGLCLKKISEDLEDGNILKEALLAPYKEIQASVAGGLVIGPDILDPMEAEFYAVEHATQVVANLATVETITVEIEDIQPGEGYTAIARALGEMALSDRIHKGQLKESEREMERDNMMQSFGVPSIDEAMALDNG